MNKGIKYILAGLIGAGMALSSQAGNVTVNWSAGDVTGISLNGGHTPLPAGDLIMIGTFSSGPVSQSLSLANFTPFATGASGSNSIPGFFSISSFNPEPAPAHQQIYMVAINSAVLGTQTQVGIWDVAKASASNWTFPASTDIPNSTTIDIEQLFNGNAGTASPTFAPGGAIVTGQNPVFVANDPNDVSTSTTWLPLAVPVPEPSSIVLVALGLLGGLGVIRRRRS